MSEKKVFDLEPTSYEDGSYWVGVEEAGFHNYFIADNLDEFVTDAEQMMKAQELADARPSILSLPDLSDTSPILQELYLQIRNGQEDMGIVEKGNPLYTQENIDAMHKDIEKYHLRNVVEEQGDNILGFGDLLSQFRMSFDRMLKKQQATENAKDTELPALIDAGDWHLDPTAMQQMKHVKTPIDLGPLGYVNFGNARIELEGGLEDEEAMEKGSPFFLNYDKYLPYRNDPDAYYAPKAEYADWSERDLQTKEVELPENIHAVSDDYSPASYGSIPLNPDMHQAENSESLKKAIVKQLLKNHEISFEDIPSYRHLKETKRAFYSRWQQEQKVATVTKNGMTFKDMLLAACKQRLANGEKPSKLGKEMKEAMKSVQLFLGKENAR